MKKIEICILLILVLPFLTGFRVMQGRWDVDRTQPTLWLKFDSGYLGKEFKEIEEFEEALEGVAPALRKLKIVQMVVDDYNSIPDSFIRIAIYPDDEFDIPTDPLDTPFSEDATKNRIIEIKDGAETPVVAGAAALESDPLDASTIIRCEIIVNEIVSQDAKQLKGTLTHEIGHCLGLHHNHPDVDSIMSYNRFASYGLGVDDKMGITFLYPTDPSLAAETATYGASCEVRD